MKPEPSDHVSTLSSTLQTRAENEKNEADISVATRIDCVHGGFVAVEGKDHLVVTFDGNNYNVDSDFVVINYDT